MQPGSVFGVCGIGCVGHVLTSGELFCGTGTRSTGTTGLPVTPLSTHVQPNFVTSMTTGTVLPFACLTSASTAPFGRAESQRSCCTVWLPHLNWPVLVSRATIASAQRFAPGPREFHGTGLPVPNITKWFL